jgi:small-conductance mechanosensitive channel/CRP-like cAMP-binding protein
LRPLLAPLAVLALLVAVGALGGRPLEARLPAYWLLLLAPLLVLLVRACGLLFEGFFRRGRGEAPPALLRSLVSVLLYGVGAGFVAHRFFGFELTPFLATSAVVGAVVGLALQETLGNLFAGISMHTEAPFRVGDWIRIGEIEGRVEQVSWRAVRLKTWSGDGVTIPNNEVSRRSVLNYSQPIEPHSRTVTVGVSYETPPNKVFAVLAELLEQVPGLVRDPPPNLRLIGYRDSAMEYEVRYHVRAYEDYRRVESEIYRLIWYHFRRHRIEIPFPIRTVHLHQAEGRGAGTSETPAQRLERALRSIDLFRALSESELRLALQNFRHLHYAAGERIIEEGSPGDSFFVIDRGVVEVSKLLGGAPRVLAQLSEGHFFGEMALLTGEARSASVTARSDVDVYTIDKQGFEQIVVQNPHVTEDISSILAARRDALSQAEGDAGAAVEESAASARKRDLLARIRGYFGI